MKGAMLLGLPMSLGRWTLALMAFLMPLIFCRETMYVFQVKIALLQYGGMLLLAFMVLSVMVEAFRLPNSTSSSKGLPMDVFWRWPLWLMLAFVGWQCFKSWDSISTVISWRQMSRVVWLPVVTVAVLYFIRSKRDLLSLLGVVVFAAVLTHLVTWLLYLPWTRNLWLGERGPNLLVDMADTWLWPWLEEIFYPEPFRDVLEKKFLLKEQKGEAVMPLHWNSLNPGKQEAGTFGNKNFLAAYLNITVPLMLWRAWSGFLFLRSRLGFRSSMPMTTARICLLSFHVVYGALLVFLSMVAVYHLIQLGNRGSWLGLGFAAMICSLVAVCCYVPRSYRKGSLLGGALLFVLGVSVLYSLNPRRFESIFTVSHGSNELRRLIWSSYGEAWWSDGDWDGAESAWKRRLTGFGHYTFRVVYPKVRSPRIFQIEFQQHNTETSHAHNEYLNLLGELGFLGLGLYLALVTSLLVLFLKGLRRGECSRWSALKMALLMAFLSVLVHQMVSVGPRYTGLAFHVWLVMGLMMLLVFRRGLWGEAGQGSVAQKLGDSGIATHGRRFSRLWFRALVVKAGPVLLLVILCFVSTPSVKWPIQWIRSQHFFEMGQIYYASIRNYQQRLAAVKQEHRVVSQQLKSAPPQIDRAPLEAKLQKLLHSGQRLQGAMSFYQQLANRYFEAGQKVDPAHFESLYIGANMAVQLGNRSMAFGKLDVAGQYYKYALGCYQKIEKELPCFVQLQYWKGVCFKGLGSIAMNQKREAEGRSHFERALGAYDQYELQDPSYPDLFLDRYYCYSQMGDRERGLDELVALLINMETGGKSLFSSTKRYDSRYLLEVLSSSSREPLAQMAEQLRVRVMDYHAGTCLLPFVPKTDRHIKNSFRLLREQ